MDAFEKLLLTLVTTVIIYFVVDYFNKKDSKK